MLLLGILIGVAMILTLEVIASLIVLRLLHSSTPMDGRTWTRNE